MAEHRRYHHGDLRNALVAAAARMVAEHGAEHFSLREAAREVGVSANAAYRHFEDKAALLHAVAEEGFASLAEAMTDALDAAAPDGQLGAVARAYLGFVGDDPHRFRLMFGVDGLRRGTSRPWPAAPFGVVLDGLVSAGRLTAGQRAGGELVVWSLFHGHACLALEGAFEPEEDHVERLVAFALAGLQAQGRSG